VPRDLPTSRAAGFVLTRDRPGSREPDYLLLVNRRDGMPGLAKGHRDGDEEDLETARRETREETGLTDLEVDPWFRSEIAYRVRKAGEVRWKTVVYFRARVRSGEVRLSDEHTSFAWQPLPETLRRLTFESLRNVLRDAALHAKDPALFRMHPPSEDEADHHLAGLPGADAALLGHLRGSARIARATAVALSAHGVPVNADAAAAGALLHDAGRAIGRHADHQIAGLRHLRGTPLAAYGFACVSHFTKGATGEELLAAGLPAADLEAFRRAIDIHALSWEERCVALADACMKGPDAVRPQERFADLRRRYGEVPLVDLQERRTAVLRAEMEAVLGEDPLGSLGLA
jgi:8-oxo-dGTP pyrophosphatase MutT (NUDIX family)